jgi:hypothetical protein
VTVKPTQNDPPWRFSMRIGSGLVSLSAIVKSLLSSRDSGASLPPSPVEQRDDSRTRSRG